MLGHFKVSLIKLSDADIAIFGGDLNASPIENPHHPYGKKFICYILYISYYIKLCVRYVTVSPIHLFTEFSC